MCVQHIYMIIHIYIYSTSVYLDISCQDAQDAQQTNNKCLYVYTHIFIIVCYMFCVILLCFCHSADMCLLDVWIFLHIFGTCLYIPIKPTANNL